MSSSLFAIESREVCVEEDEKRLHFREIKITLGLDVLRCLTPLMIEKELLLHIIAYNLVRALMQRAAILHCVELCRVSFLPTRSMPQRANPANISRSKVLTEVPIGYVRTETNGIEKTPDRQVQEAIAEVFLQFRRLGSVRQVLLWYRQEKVPLCSYRRDARPGKCFGALPGYNRILAILKNPVYAGAFAYGRTSTRSRVIEGRARKTAGDSVPVEQWVGTISFWYSTG